MDIFVIAFFSLFAIFLAYILYSLLTKKGSKQFVDLNMNTNNAELIGEFPEIEFRPKLSLIPIKQKLRLYKCSDSNGPFYVLEDTQSSPGGINRHFSKITAETASQLKHLLN